MYVMHCDVCSSFPLHDMMKAHQKNEQALLTVMAKAPAREGFGRFIYDQNTMQVLHFTNEEGSKSTAITEGTVNCGVYLFTVSEMYSEPTYKGYGESYARILGASKDDDQRTLAKYFNEFAN